MAAAEDIIGVEDIIGYEEELEHLLGAEVATGAAIATGANPMVRRRRHPHAGRGRADLMHALAARHAAALTPRAFTKSREYTLGFRGGTNNGTPAIIPGGAPSILIAQPQVPFKGRRLIIPSDVAGALIILNLIIGKNPVLVSADPVAARAYTELGVGVDLNMDTAQISQIISLSLSNTSGASVAVTATLIGTAME
jgi:hypothetical protein